jgi:hypothetical protein
MDVQEFLRNGGRIMVLPTRKARGVAPLSQQFGGNRVFLASSLVASASQGGMLRMGTKTKRYGN